jgi:hypothetical protein
MQINRVITIAYLLDNPSASRLRVGIGLNVKDLAMGRSIRASANTNY